MKKHRKTRTRPKSRGCLPVKHQNESTGCAVASTDPGFRVWGSPVRPTSFLLSQFLGRRIPHCPCYFSGAFSGRRHSRSGEILQTCRDLGDISPGGRQYTTRFGPLGAHVLTTCPAQSRPSGLEVRGLHRDSGSEGSRLCSSQSSTAGDGPGRIPGPPLHAEPRRHVPGIERFIKKTLTFKSEEKPQVGITTPVRPTTG